MPKGRKEQGQRQFGSPNRTFGRGRGRGGGGGGGGGMGATGFCVCPRCGQRAQHRPGTPCLDERCPSCGVAMVREGSLHHQEIESRRTDNTTAD
jgi:hypothetical protein